VLQRVGEGDQPPGRRGHGSQLLHGAGTLELAARRHWHIEDGHEGAVLVVSVIVERAVVHPRLLAELDARGADIVDIEVKQGGGGHVLVKQALDVPAATGVVRPVGRQLNAGNLDDDLQAGAQRDAVVFVVSVRGDGWGLRQLLGHGGCGCASSRLPVRVGKR